MTKQLLHTKKLLDTLVIKRNNPFELSSYALADPIQVASRYKDEYIALICALFGYGNAKAIVNFLNSLDFSLLQKNENEIKQRLLGKVYRFQNEQDIIQFFITLRRLKQNTTLEEIFTAKYLQAGDILQALSHLIQTLYSVNSYRSRGYLFLLGKPYDKEPISTYKRWHMYLRWMVRKDNLDMGLWRDVSPSKLYAPLDTHTHKMALQFALIKRKTYDFKAVRELTYMFRKFDRDDPIKYDFALYRLGQEKLF